MPLDDRARKYAENIYHNRLHELDREAEEATANLLESLGAKGLRFSGTADRGQAQIQAARIAAHLRARLDGYFQTCETFNIPLTPDVVSEITGELHRLRQLMVGARRSSVGFEQQMVAVRTGGTHAGSSAQLAEYARILERETTPAVNSLIRELENKAMEPPKLQSQPTVTNVYHLHGANPRVNVNSEDKSINVSTVSSEQLFETMRDQITNALPANRDREDILHRLSELEHSRGTADFATKYKDFIATAANHMVLIAPFIPALTELLK
jgi:hypothetical protein